MVGYDEGHACWLWRGGAAYARNSAPSVSAVHAQTLHAITAVVIRVLVRIMYAGIELGLPQAMVEWCEQWEPQARFCTATDQR